MNPARPAQSRNAPPPRKDSLQNRNRPPGILKRTTSIDSDASSDDSASTTRSPTRPAPSPYHGNSTAAESTRTLANQAPRPARKVSYDAPNRGQPSAVVQQAQNTHRRQHSQGFFEPSLPTAPTPSISNLSASHIAAQAAFHVQNSLHARRRSQTAPIDNANNVQQNANQQPSYQRKPSTLSIQTSDSSNPNSRAPSQTRSTSGHGNHINPQNTAAMEGAIAAVAKRSPLNSPLLQQGHQVASPTFISDRDIKPAKEKSRMKIFSKPKALNVAGSKDQEKQEKKSVTIQSPRRPGIYPSQTVPLSSNKSLVSLADSTITGASSFYSTANNSTSTLMPSDRVTLTDKEKPRHNFLSRQRNKLKEGADLYSSAASNSRPTDPNGPQPLYSFAPSSPGPGSTFSMTKSKTGLDLRHGGRALREKKREEKAAAGTFVPPSILAASESRDQTPSHEWGGTAAPSMNIFGPPSTGLSNAELASGLGNFGLPGMTIEDAWPLLKARLLNIFEGVDIRTPIEDFNRLVLAHLQRCVQHQTPSLIIEDLRELLQTGFYSLDQILRRIPDDRLVPHLVDTWSFVFGTVLPFIQAVFHPLDLEFKGHGQILSSKDAREFWGALPFTFKPAPNTTTPMGPPTRPSTASNAKAQPTLFPLHSILSVRTIALLTFRDTIILPRYDLLLATFGRLPVESLNAIAALEMPRSPPPFRPGTANSSNSSHNLDPNAASFNSQSSTLLDSSTASSLGARSRATSNTSAISSGSAVGSFHFSSPRPHAGSNSSAKLPPMATPRSYVPHGVPALDSAKVTQTAGKMLQCVSVLAGLQAPGIFSTIASGRTAGVARADDGEQAETEARKKMEELGKVLKLNWLGRSRTGRNRRGLVGTTRTPGTAVGVAG